MIIWALKKKKKIHQFLDCIYCILVICPPRHISTTKSRVSCFLDERQKHRIHSFNQVYASPASLKKYLISLIRHIHFLLHLDLFTALQKFNLHSKTFSFARSILVPLNDNSALQTEEERNVTYSLKCKYFILVFLNSLLLKLFVLCWCKSFIYLILAYSLVRHFNLRKKIMLRNPSYSIKFLRFPLPHTILKWKKLHLTMKWYDIQHTSESQSHE